MIHSFHIRNFRSIRDATLDFSFAEGKAPNGFATTTRMPFIQEPGSRFRGVPVLALFGPNASGKSNILNAINAFRRQVIGLDPEMHQFFQPNKLHGPYQPTEMELVFSSGGMNLRYLLENDGGRFVREELEADGRPVFSIHRAKADLSPLATLAYPLKNLESFLQVESGRTPDGSFARPFLSVLGRNYPGLDLCAKAAFDFFRNNIIPSATDNLGMGIFPLDVRCLAEARNTDENSVLADIASIIRKLDVPIAGLAINRTKGPLPLPETPPFYQAWALGKGPSGEQVNIHLTTIHRDEAGNDVTFRFNEEESAGTQHLVFLITRMLLALERGATVFIDELDRSLHPLLLRAILNLFVERSRNPKGARLVFSTHCTDLLDNSILRLSEVAIVSNHPKAGTRIHRLSDLRGEGRDVRNVTVFRKNYLEGYYSGVPYPSL